MIITDDKLALMAGVAVNDNMRSVRIGINEQGARAGLDRPHRLAHYLAQILHENGRFKYDREVWGPTPAQERYDTRTDLGNTPEKDGDGEKYKGRTGTQITGKSNYEQFRDWCRATGLNPPDFVADPDLVNTDPWEGLGPIWYWTTRKLNALADKNDIEQITKRINGGRNGLEDRITMYERVAMVLNGFDLKDVEGAQRTLQAEGYLPQGDDQIDGDIGPKTRAALHMRLAKEMPASAPEVETVKPGPVVEEREVEVEVEVPKVPKGAEKRGWNWLVGIGGILMAPVTWFLELDAAGKVIVGSISAAAVIFFLWRGELVVRRARAILAEIGKSDA